MATDLEELKAKLNKLEKGLRDLLQSAVEDLEIAKHLQRLMHRERLQIPGIECLARYISAADISAESFDLIPSRKGKDVWWIASWTESFGLSSVLLQSVLKLQADHLIGAEKDLELEELFDDLSVNLSTAKKIGKYKLFVAKLNTLSLKISGYSVGCLPLIKRQSEKNSFKDFEFAFMTKDSTKDLTDTKWPGTEFLESQSAAAPVLSNKAYAFQGTVNPGTRLFYLSSSWCKEKSPQETLKALNQRGETHGQSLIDDLNFLLMKAEDNLKEEKANEDLIAIALSVDIKKLHLA